MDDRDIAIEALTIVHDALKRIAANIDEYLIEDLDREIQWRSFACFNGWKALGRARRSAV